MTREMEPEVARKGAVTTYNGIEIKTSNIWPPIPSREFDWAAWLDGYEERGWAQAYGRTRETAVANLIQQLWEDGR